MNRIFISGHIDSSKPNMSVSPDNGSIVIVFRLLFSLDGREESIWLRATGDLAAYITDSGVADPKADILVSGQLNATGDEILVDHIARNGFPRWLKETAR